MVLHGCFGLCIAFTDKRSYSFLGFLSSFVKFEVSPVSCSNGAKSQAFGGLIFPLGQHKRLCTDGKELKLE